MTLVSWPFPHIKYGRCLVLGVKYLALGLALEVAETQVMQETLPVLLQGLVLDVAFPNGVSLLGLAFLLILLVDNLFLARLP